MKKLFVGLIATLVLLAISSWLLIVALEKATTETEAMLGKRVIIEKDTATIVDYSGMNNTYTLSNGKKINIELAKKLPTVN